MTLAPHIVFVGGGTAGHLFPGLAVVERLRAMSREARITLVGSGRPFERRQASLAGCEYLGLPCRPLPRGPREAFAFLSDNLAGYCAGQWFLRSERARVVVGLGGYVSVPTARAAVRIGIPLVLLEPNALPGRATRWLAPRAARIFAAQDVAGRRLKPARIIADRFEASGTPIRQAFFDAQRSRSPVGRPRLIVLGGSGGARSLNEQVPLAIYSAGPALADWEIVHQSGERDFELTAALYRKLGLAVRVAPFIENMPAALAGAELAISRAGGSTLAELAATGTPSILIPFPRAADNHQTHNALVHQSAGAARVVVESASGSRLDHRIAAELRAMASDVDLRRQMRAAARRLARPTAAHRVAECVLELARAAMPTMAARAA